MSTTLLFTVRLTDISGHRSKYERKLAVDLKGRVWDFSFTIKCTRYNYRVVIKIKIELCKRGWAIRDQLVVPFSEKGRDEEINIQRETRCPGR